MFSICCGAILARIFIWIGEILCEGRVLLLLCIWTSFIDDCVTLKSKVIVRERDVEILHHVYITYNCCEYLVTFDNAAEIKWCVIIFQLIPSSEIQEHKVLISPIVEKEAGLCVEIQDAGLKDLNIRNRDLWCHVFGWT